MIYVVYFKYNFNTHIKIHPYVSVEYLEDVTNMVTIGTNGIHQYIYGNKRKIHTTNKMKFSNSCIIVVRVIKIVKLLSYNCKSSQT
jgi:hypothetical protein